KRKGRPTGFRVPVRNVHGAIGAGFLVAMCGDVIKMPGLPSTPGACKIDIDEEGRIVGLF
ncbi:MAG TPA: formate--tetrahydrofolate ligase, partial [Candidatus Hydrogenedentes bacterium]|nr:formate--tetrahydrofolate ligase [Candidatus Hydrogenedentota bacterium]